MSKDQKHTEMSKYELKRLMNELDDIRGRNTELVSLYIPAGYDMSKISEFVTSEQSEAENIKSKHTRTNVQDALGKIGRKVKEEQKTPENGVAFFAGNVSDTEGRPDIKIWEVIPPQPIESRHYRCDKEFVLEPLKNMVVDDRVYGLIVLDKSEAAIGYLQGSHVKTAYTLDSNVPGKTRAGGQCLHPETVVQLSDGRVEEIQDLEVGDSVKSADFDSMEMKDSKITDKWENEKKLYRIETKKPQTSIKASGDHEVFTKDKGVEARNVEDLKEGEKLLLPEKYDSKDKRPEIETGGLYNSYEVSDEGRQRIKEERKMRGLSQEELGGKLGRTQTAVSKIEKGERDIKKDFLEGLVEELDLGDGFIDQYCRGKKIKLPNEVDEGLAQVLGYFAGDGSFDPERLNFHEQDREVAEKYRDLLKQKFGCETSIRFRDEKNYYLLRAFGKPLVRLFKDEFPEIKKSRNTEIPEKIMISGDEVLRGFIRGFYDAEGHCSESRGRIGVSANNEKLMQQIQQQLMRYEVISSLRSYDNSENPYSDNTRFTVEISDQVSAENFAEKIGFTLERKNRELEKIIEDQNSRNHNRQIITEGPEVRKKLEEHGKPMEEFKSANMYLQGRREISEKAFEENFVKESSGQLKKDMENILGSEILPVEIDSIKEIEEQKTIDISVEAGSFVANGLIVHNSAQRFARIRKQMLKTFLTEISDKAQNAFLPKAREGKLLGIVIGGPGFVKDKLVEDDYLHKELQERVIATESIGHSGEGALKELVQKAEESIDDSEAVREKKMVNEFFDHLKSEDGKSEYGVEQVKQALDMGAVETLLVSEDLEMYEAKYECPQGHEKTVYEREAHIDDSIECDECNEEIHLEEMSHVIDAFGDKAEEMSSELEIISTNHEEGQRLMNMSGIAAILRYRIR